MWASNEDSTLQTMGGNLLLPEASVQSNRTFQVEDSVAALWKWLQHCDVGICKGKEKRLIFSHSCLKWSNICIEYRKDWEADFENGTAALKYALWKMFGWGMCHARWKEGYKWKWKKTPSPALAASCAPFQVQFLFSSWQSYCCIHNFHRALESFKVKGVKNERRLLLLLLRSLWSLFRIII